MTPKKIEVVGLGLNADTIDEYFQNVVLPRMKWKPKGIVLHNTEYPTLREWPGLSDNRPITVSQRLDLMNHYYAQVKGWPSGPHAIVDATRIWIFSPPWKPGSGSPSWNDTHFHVELVGDYSREIMPDAVRDGGMAVCAAMYNIMDVWPSVKNFRFHKEDPRTRHKRCPGVNVGNKDLWVKMIARKVRR